MPRTKQPLRKYAEGTDVAVEKSRAEMEKLLDAHGASHFALMRDEARTIVVYVMKGRRVRHVIKTPLASEVRAASRSAIENAIAAEHRRRWRATLLITKAKLEMVASGESTFDREFLADTVLPNGQTVAEAWMPRIAAAYENNEMPSLMLGTGD